MHYFINDVCTFCLTV